MIYRWLNKVKTFKVDINLVDGRGIYLIFMRRNNINISHDEGIVFFFTDDEGIVKGKVKWEIVLKN